MASAGSETAPPALASTPAPTEEDPNILRVSDPVYTPYGGGIVRELRESDSVVVVELEWGSTKAIPNTTTEQPPPAEEGAATPASKSGNNGALAYLRASDVQKRKRLFEMDDVEKLALAARHRNQGNVFFGMGDHRVALEKYEIARVYLRQLSMRAGEEFDKSNISLLNNVALAHTKLGNLRDAVATATEALESLRLTGSTFSPVKTLYLRALAYKKLGEYDLGIEDLIKAMQLEPSNKSVREEIDAIRRARAADKSKVADMFKGKLVSSTPPPTSPSPPAAPRTPQSEMSLDPVVEAPPKKTQQPAPEAAAPAVPAPSTKPLPKKPAAAPPPPQKATPDRGGLVATLAVVTTIGVVVGVLLALKSKGR